MRFLCFCRSYGKYLCVIKKIQIILYHIEFEFLDRQRSIGDTLNKRMAVKALRDLPAALYDSFRDCIFHIIIPLFPDLKAPAPKIIPAVVNVFFFVNISRLLSH